MSQPIERVKSEPSEWEQLGLLEECIVDAVGENDTNQRIVHAADPAVVRRSVTGRRICAGLTHAKQQRGH